MHMQRVVSMILLYLFFMPAFLIAEESLDLERGIKLFDEKQYMDAQQYFEALSKKYPKNAEIAHHIGKSYLATNEYKKAVKLLEKAIKLDGRRSDYHFVLGIAYSRHINEVGMLKQISLANKMKSTWIKAVNIDGKNKDARVALIMFYLQAPGLFGGSLDEAEKHIAILKQQYPHRTFAAEGTVAEKKEEYEKAEKCYRRAFKENRDPVNVLNLANYLNRRGQTDEAISLFNQYLNMDLGWRDTGKAFVYYTLGTIYEKKKMYDESEKALLSARNINQEKWFDKEIQKKLREIRKKI